MLKGHINQDHKIGQMIILPEFFIIQTSAKRSMFIQVLHRNSSAYSHGAISSCFAMTFLKDCQGKIVITTDEELLKNIFS